MGSERVRSIPGQHSMGLVFSVSLSGFTVTALSPSPPPPPRCRKGASARAEACKSGRRILASQRSGLSRHSLCSLSDSSCLRSGRPIPHRSLPPPSCPLLQASLLYPLPNAQGPTATGRACVLISPPPQVSSDIRKWEPLTSAQNLSDHLSSGRGSIFCSLDKGCSTQ